MKSGAWMLAGLVTGVLLITGCNNTPVGGAGLEGTWTGALTALLTVVDVDLPVAMAPEARLVLDKGAVAITLKPQSWFLRLLVKAVIEGAYTTDNTTSLDKMSLSLGEAKLKVLFFSFPLKDLAKTTQCIYKVKETNTLYIFPEYDKLPDALRFALEANPDAIPWEGVTVDGVTYTPLKFVRAA